MTLLTELGKKLTVLLEERNCLQALALIESQPTAIQNNASIEFCRADCHYELGDLSKAAAIYGKLSQDSNSSRRTHATYNLALCLRELKKHDEALIHLRTLPVEFLKTRSLLGEILYYTARGEKHAYEEAATLLSSWLVENPDDGLSHHLLASCLNHLDRHEEALEQLKECMRSGFSPKSVLRDIIIELDWLGRPTEIAAFARSSLTHETDPTRELTKLAKERGR